MPLTIAQIEETREAYREICQAVIEERNPALSHPALGADWAHDIDLNAQYKTNMIARIKARFADWASSRGINDFASFICGIYE